MQTCANMCEPIPESLHLTRGYTKLELTEAGVDQFSAAGRSGDDGGVRAHSCGRGSVQPTGEVGEIMRKIGCDRYG